MEADGSAITFFDPEEKYIWALVVDAEGNLFAATGDKGTIYKITPGGDAEPFYQTDANHVLSLAVDARGNLLAGTEAPGQVFRIDRDGQAFVLLDSPYREIRALKVDRNGVIYAAALSGSSPAAAPPAPQPSAPTAHTPVPTVSVTTAITTGGVSVSEGGGQSALGRPHTSRRPDRRRLSHRARRRLGYRVAIERRLALRCDVRRRRRAR